MLEELLPEVAHGPLADVDHDAVVAIGAQDAQDIHRRQPAQGGGQGAKVGLGGLGQGEDVVVDEALHEEGAGQGGQGGAQAAPGTPSPAPPDGDAPQRPGGVG